MAFRFTIRQKQGLIILHVLAMVSWLGGAMSMLLLGSYMMFAENGEQLYYTVGNMELIDHYFIRYSALVALLTGIALSVWTPWGLFKYYWIVIKLVLTLGLIVFGIAYMGDWLYQVVQGASKLRGQALNDEGFIDAAHALTSGAIANISALVFMAAISYLKPFGKIKRGGRP